MVARLAIILLYFLTLTTINFLSLLGYFHQTVVCCEKVGSGNETIVSPSIQIVLGRANLWLGYRVVV